MYGSNVPGAGCIRELLAKRITRTLRPIGFSPAGHILANVR